jgi:hypothetical protein
VAAFPDTLLELKSLCGCFYAYYVIQTNLFLRYLSDDKDRLLSRDIFTGVYANLFEL